MFKFKLGRKQPEENEARRRLQKELFGLNKVSKILVYYGDESFYLKSQFRYVNVAFLHVHQR